MITLLRKSHNIMFRNLWQLNLGLLLFYRLILSTQSCLKLKQCDSVTCIKLEVADHNFKESSGRFGISVQKEHYLSQLRTFRALFFLTADSLYQKPGAELARQLDRAVFYYVHELYWNFDADMFPLGSTIR